MSQGEAERIREFNFRPIGYMTRQRIAIYFTLLLCVYMTDVYYK